jgi:hypothetical protein
MSRFDEQAETAATIPLSNVEARTAHSEREPRLALDAIPALVATFQPEGSCRFVYAGLALQDEGWAESASPSPCRRMWVPPLEPPLHRAK